MISLHVWEYGGGEEAATESIRLAEELAMPHLDIIHDVLSRWDSCEEN